MNMFTKIDKGSKYHLLSIKDNIDFDNLDNIFGVPYDKFIGFNQQNNFITIAGVQYPNYQLSKIIQNIENNQQQIINTHNFFDNFDFKLDKFKLNQYHNPFETQKEINIDNVDDIFKKYQ